MKRKFVCLIVTFLTTISVCLAQKPVSVYDTMPDFTLLSTDGAKVSLSDFKGKNVMLVFPRGKVGEHWCQLCHYQYAEFADIENKEKIQEKYNLQVLFILPYDRKTVEQWVKMLPNQLSIVEKWKNPDNPENISEGEKNWMLKCRKLFPKKFIVDSANIPKPFIVLADEERKLSMDLGLFTTFWDYSYVEQNISSIFIIDKNGILQFKYVSQNTMDRPRPEYLLKFISKVIND